MSGSLEGVRVLEFAALIAGPSCAKYLADHGAEVIKVERHPDGDISRHSFSTDGSGRGPMFLQQNAGKKSVCIDLKSPQGIALVLDLVDKVDVVIEAFTPGVMERLGLGYEALRARNPKVIVCSVSGFGQSGPNAKRPGYAHVAHAMSGWLAIQFMRRDPPEVPRGPGVAIGDTTAGLTAFGAVCAALFKRERTGEGEHIDIALFDALFCSNDYVLQAALKDGDVQVWYHPVHRTRDGYLTANVGPDFRTWRNVCAAMGRPQLLEDPRFADQAAVVRNMEAAGAIVSEWLATLASDEAEAILAAHHIPSAPVLDLEEAVRQPQVVERGLTVPVDDPVFGPMELINSAFRYAHAQSGVRGPAPMLGQHNGEVLGELLGMSDAQVSALEARGVLRKGEGY
jgi:formyl-CoA transferase